MPTILPLNPGVRHRRAIRLLAELPCLRPEAVAAGMSNPAPPTSTCTRCTRAICAACASCGAIRKCRVTGLQRLDDGWRVTLAGGEAITAGAVVNAAVPGPTWSQRWPGVPPIGLEPRRRTAFTFPVPAGMDASGWPAVIGMGELLLQTRRGPAAGLASQRRPGGAARRGTRGWTLALGMHRIEQVTSFQIRRPSHSWAGLRSFIVADGDLVIGWDNHVPRFFWLAAQGGYGIQSAAGAALLARQLALDEPLSASLVEGA